MLKMKNLVLFTHPMMFQTGMPYAFFFIQLCSGYKALKKDQHKAMQQ